MDRRNFFKLLGITLISGLAFTRKVLAETLKDIHWVNAAAPMPAANKFNMDATKVPRVDKVIGPKTYKAANQKCANCAMFMNKKKVEGTEIGQCALFMNDQANKPWFVKDTSSCMQWTPGVGA